MVPDREEETADGDEPDDEERFDLTDHHIHPSAAFEPPISTLPVVAARSLRERVEPTSSVV